MRNISLKYQLILPFVLMILLVSAGTAWMMHGSGQAAVNLLVRRVLHDLVTQISTTTEAHLNYAFRALDSFVGDDETSTFASARQRHEMEVLEQRARQTLRKAQEIGTYVYFGGADGRFVGLYKVNTYMNELYLRSSGASQRHIYAVGETDAPPTLLRSDTFDPRTRPWYVSALRKTGASWSPVYFDFTSKRPVITLTRPIRDEQGVALGVAAVDIELYLITERLRSLAISQNGMAFVMDPQGRIVATSEAELPLVAEDGKAAGVSVDELKNPLVRAALAAITEWRNHPPAPGETALAEIESHAGPLSLAATSIGKSQGIDWTAVVIVPSADFMQDISRSYNRSLGIAIASVCLSLLIGIWLLNRVLRDIRQLNDAAIRIGRGEAPPLLNIERNDELGQLARSFHEMGHNLRTDALTGSFNREYLFNRLRSLRNVGETQVSVSQRFALLFVDLDDFKGINDRHGHDVGDAVLVEIAARLNASVRASDTVVRYGGDEFVVLLNDMASESDVGAAAEKMRALVERPIVIGDCETHTGISIGWALCPANGTDTETLLKTADQRMFQDKTRRKQNRTGTPAASAT